MKLTRSLLCIAAVLSFTLASSAQAQTNLLTNGSFEDGFSGWSLSMGNFSFAGNDPLFAHSGNGFANLEQTGGIGTLSQSFSTVIGQMYSISFFLANDSGVTPNSFSASFGPTSGMTPQYSVSNQTTITGYQNIQFNAVATSTTSTLTFSFRHDDDFWRLDTVTVIPEPSTNALMILSAVGVLGFVQYRKVKARRSAEA